ncbi:Dual specificity protein phosphatase [Halorubrum californiense DSM 19288]|uniref:Dual specificity protein phosphatase n=1 Tax=Halorubrum californiense DSM 19288 TaxID=1227465 RepID=M0EI61_9EURY|nr:MULTISPECIES: dual specificity protein phosphatase [Halorubrum]ELZ46089.1 Dual specificity protein phosphatase [Halorubrum californiense DSM 19288]TKX68267.1 protein phosphatase [Halorubrum sp. GN11GM_10-3_MGM]
MDEVADGIFVGTVSDAEDESLLRRRGVDAVVSLTHDDPDTGAVARVDAPMTDGPRNEYDAFAAAAETVVKRREAGQRVLIHCSAGASRSPAVAAAAMTRLTDRSLGEAFEQVLAPRSEVDPHDALVRRAATFATEGRE